MKKIVVASDSFKGSVSSIEVAECAELATIRSSGLRGRENPGWGWGRRYRGDFDYGDGWRSRILCRT